MSTSERLPATLRATSRIPARPSLRRVPLVVLPLAGLVAWQLVVWLAAPRAWLLPSPEAVLEVMWSDRGRLWYHAQATIVESAVGFALAATIGVLMAMAIAASAAVERTLYPWLIASQAIPILAVAPLVAIWLSYGSAQVMVAFIIAFFPVVVTGVDGLRGVNAAMGDAVRTLGASRAWTFRRVTFPASLPSLFSGLRMAAVFAVTGAVVAEYVGAGRGLGYLSEFSTAEFQTARSFAAIVLLAVIGMAFFGAVGIVERILLPHRRHHARPAWKRW